MILEGKKVWVTGASGTIGGAIAARFKEEGAEVFTKRIEITDLNAVLETSGTFQPDILVNCAGYYPFGAVSITTAKKWSQAVDVNLTGSFYLTRSVITNMMYTGGKIIHMSGGGAAYGRANFSAYAASKAGLIRFIECVAEEVEPFNIQINAIAPGSVKSKMNPEGTETPDKAVKLALYLASQESNHITGRLIHVNEDYRKPMTEEGGKLRRIPL